MTTDETYIYHIHVKVESGPHRSCTRMLNRWSSLLKISGSFKEPTTFLE